MNRILTIIAGVALFFSCQSCFMADKPRILVSTDIGGTDPDDNQSIMHYLLYCNEVDCEGLVSSPSYGDGSKEEILRMIGLYEKDLPKLKQHAKGWPSPEYLRSITVQGRKGAAPLKGFSEPTEGSLQIVKAALKKDRRPLYVLVWGGLDDLAQALHDSPEMASRIRVYWIGGPNKKWSVNSYVYIVENFPDLWFIENNSSYRGFIADKKVQDIYNAGFYEHFVKGRGNLGEDFYNYLQGNPKLGDTPALLYMMDGDPADPEGESWGGSFVRCNRSARIVLNAPTTAQDTVQTHSVMEFHVAGPVRDDIEEGNACMALTIAGQRWEGYYMGDGDYMVRYATYKTGTQPYTIVVDGIENPIEGSVTVENIYPGPVHETDWALGPVWWTDSPDPELFWNGLQGAETVYKWRKTAFEDWGQRCQWLL